MVVKILALTDGRSWPCTTESQEEKSPGTVFREMTDFSEILLLARTGTKDKDLSGQWPALRSSWSLWDHLPCAEFGGCECNSHMWRNLSPDSPGMGFSLWASLQPGLLPRPLLQFLGLCSWGFFSQVIFWFRPLMDSLFFHSRYSSKPCDLAPDETRVWIRWILVSGRAAYCSEQSGQFAACPHHSQPNQQGRARYEVW